MPYRKLTARLNVLAVLLLVLPVLVLPMAQAEPLLGTLRATGPAWIASGTADWSQLSASRTLVGGDRLRTGDGAYLLVDLGSDGVIGLFADSEVGTHASEPVVDVLKGKVAFHLAADSELNIRAKSGRIAASSEKAEGYVEYQDSTPVVVVEYGELNVRIAGVDSKVGRGERIVIENDGSTPQVVGMEGVYETDERKATAAMAAEERSVAETPDYGRRRLLTWTAIGVVAVGATVGGIAASGGGGGGGDSNGSPGAE
jgi:hypothetical protein